MNGQAGKNTIKCITCEEEIKELSSPYFAEAHIAANPGHLEYRIFIEMTSAKVPDSKPTLVFDDGTEKH